jgi:hypothetical protein
LSLGVRTKNGRVFGLPLVPSVFGRKVEITRFVGGAFGGQALWIPPRLDAHGENESGGDRGRFVGVTRDQFHGNVLPRYTAPFRLPAPSC